MCSPRVERSDCKEQNTGEEKMIAMSMLILFMCIHLYKALSKEDILPIFHRPDGPIKACKQEKYPVACGNLE